METILIDIITIIPWLGLLLLLIEQHIELRICVLGRRVNVLIGCVHVYAIALKRTRQVGRLAGRGARHGHAGRMESGDAL